MFKLHFTMPLLCAVLGISVAGAVPAAADAEADGQPVLLAAGTMSSFMTQGPVKSFSDCCRAESMRHSASGNKIRLVINTSQVPDYQILSDNRGRTLRIELLNTELNGTVPAGAPKSKAIKSWKTESPALNRAAWEIQFKDPISSDHVQAFTLENPHRLVVDIDTSAPSLEGTWHITPGITWTRSIIADPAFGSLLWNQLVFSRNDPNITLDIAAAHDDAGAKAPLTQIVSEHNAAAGVNGGFFNMSGGGILGVAIKDGKVIAPHVGRRPARSVLAVTQDNNMFVDRIKVLNGTPVKLNGQPCPPLRMALGAGPALLKNGQVYITAQEEQLGPGGNDITRACGRTAAAFNKSEVMLATLSGFSDSHSQGWKLPAMAKYLARKGMTEAVNMDGGGSVGMSVGGTAVGNGPDAGSYQRPIATALIVSDSRGTVYPSAIKLRLPQKLKADGRSSAVAELTALTENGKPAADGSVIFLSARGLECPASVTLQNGKASFPVKALRSPGMANVQASSMFASSSANMQLEPGKPHAILAEISSDLYIKQSAETKQNTTGPANTGNNSETAGNNSEAAEGDTENPSPRNVLGNDADDGNTADGTAGTGASPAADKAVMLRRLAVNLTTEDEWHNGLAGCPVEVKDSKGKVLSSGTSDFEGNLRLVFNVPTDTRLLHFESKGFKKLKLRLDGSTPRFEN